MAYESPEYLKSNVVTQIVLKTTAAGVAAAP